MNKTLSVDMIRCTAHGMCAEILPERITLDDWGYPSLATEPITAELEGVAKQAVAVCPVFALKLERSRKVPARRPLIGGLGAS